MDFRPLTPGACELIRKCLKGNARINLRFLTPLFRFITIAAGALVKVYFFISVRHYLPPFKKVKRPIAELKSSNHKLNQPS